MHCVICDHFENPDNPISLWNKVLVDPVTQKPTCQECQQSIIKEQKEIKAENSEPEFVSIEQGLSELERRIPGLFYGPYCPGNCLCRCTTKCKLIDDNDPTHHTLSEDKFSSGDNGNYEQGALQDPVPAV